MDWETYNIEKDDSKLLDVVLAFGEPFPPKDADGSEKMRRLSEIRGEKTPTLGSDGTSCSTAAQVHSGRNLHVLCQPFLKPNSISFRERRTKEMQKERKVVL